jgi:putative selenium metabolism protein SsnA
MLITNANVITWEDPNRILNDYAIYIIDKFIHDIGPSNKLKEKYPDEVIYDASGQYVLPGNICAHTHFYGAFSRGLAIPGEAPRDFNEILSKLWWPLDKALRDEDIYLSAMVCLIDAIKNGTTTLFDHHSSPNSVSGSLDIIADAVEKTGLRCCLAYEVSDRNGKKNARKGIEENVRFIKSVNNRGESSSRLSASFGLHASLTLSDETLELSLDKKPDDIGFHIHAAEGLIDQTDSLERSGLRVIERLNKFNILGPASIVAHAVHVNSEEIKLLRRTETWVTHQPRSNMNNAVGVAPVKPLLDSKVKLCLGNDGFSNAMWEEWKTAYLVHKTATLDPRSMSGNDVVKIAVYNNSELATRYFRDALVGKLIPGACADLIIVNYHPPTLLTEGNLPWHILFGFNENMISSTMVAGKFLMKDHELLNLDEEKIYFDANQHSREVWKRYEESFA